MRRLPPVTLLALAFLGGACGRRAEPVGLRAAEAAGTGEVPAPRVSSIAQWDPTARRFIEPPPAAAASLAAGRAAAVAEPPLREEAGPRGGRMVRLGSRFQHHLIAALGRDGAIAGTCEAGSAISSDQGRPRERDDRHTGDVAHGGP